MSNNPIQSAIQSGQFSVALDQVNTLLEKCPTDVKLWYAKALALMGMEQPEAAIAAVEYAICLEPSLAVAHRLLGKAKRTLGDQSGAIAAYKTAMKSYIDQGDKAGAQQCLSLINACRANASGTSDSAASPSTSTGISTSAPSARAVAKAPTVTKIASVVPSVSPLQPPVASLPPLVQPDTVLKQIRDLMQKERYQEALQELDWFLQVYADHVEALIHRSLIYAQQDRQDAAIRDLAKAKRQGVSNLHPTLLLQQCQVQLLVGDVDGAIANLSNLLQSPTDDTTPYFMGPQYLASVYVLRGQAHAQKHELEAALKDYDTALAADASHGKAYQSRGELYASMENWENALSDYRQAARFYLDQGQQTQYQQMQQVLSDLEMTQEEQQQAEVRIIRVPIKYKHQGIPVLAVTFDDELTVNLMLDTGASFTCITQSMACQLGVVPFGMRTCSVADGRLTDTPVGRVKSMAIGRATIDNVEVLILPDTMRHGLIGENFLQRYDVKILEHEVELHLRSRASR